MALVLAWNKMKLLLTMLAIRETYLNYNDLLCTGKQCALDAEKQRAKYGVVGWTRG